ncbi:acetylornithine deacetylase [Streptomyces sp. NPDC050161]|uniref:acetylornithine deacetylase n=1 Tax=Streptomyces sp. NPDC050161 TaxID=3365604 RepID=UPI0037B96F2A
MSARFPVRCSDSELYSHMLGILERLVGFDTTSHKSNLELISYVQGLLSSNDIDTTLHWNDERSKANLVATAGPRSGGQRGIIWSGHTDVVPVDGQKWTADPFTLRVTDDQAIGRGTADMKGFIACCLALLTQVDQAALTVPVTLLLTYEEEVGCVGARRLVPELQTWVDDSIGCVIGEPTGMKVVIGHKGKQNYRIRFTGEPKHAALAPQMPNPIVSASELAAFAQTLNEQFQSDGPHDERFTIDHSWINVGRIDGGVKPNIVPDNCLMELEIRAVPGHDCDGIANELKRFAEENLLPKMAKKSQLADISVEQLSDTPSFAIDDTHAFVELVRSAFGEEEPPEYVPFGTEAGLIWGKAGVPAVVCGPGFISEAHTADEAVPLDQLKLCLSQLQQLPLT